MTETSRYNDLKAILGHKNFYRNPVSNKITFRRKNVRIATGVTQITKAKEKVEEELARRQGRVETSVKKRLKGLSNPLLSDVWELLLEHKRSDTKPSTIKTYVKNWNVALEPFWGEKFAQDLTAENLTEFKEWYLAEHPARYFKKTFIHFQVLLKFMQKQKFINELPEISILANLDQTVEKASKRVKAGRVYTKAEIAALEEAARNFRAVEAPELSETQEALSIRAQLGVALGALCGMRKMEGLSLEWAHVDFTAGMIKVWSQKNHKWREVPMVPKLAALFRKQQKLSGSGKWVFPMPSNPERYISSQIFDKVWVKVKGLAKLKGRGRYHDLRHTFATVTAEDNWNPVTACSVLDMGLQVYQRVYCKPSFEKKTELMLKSFGGGK